MVLPSWCSGGFGLVWWVWCVGGFPFWGLSDMLIAGQQCSTQNTNTCCCPYQGGRSWQSFRERKKISQSFLCISKFSLKSLRKHEAFRWLLSENMKPFVEISPKAFLKAGDSWQNFRGTPFLCSPNFCHPSPHYKELVDSDVYFNSILEWLYL